VMGGAGHELQFDPLAALFGMGNGFHFYFSPRMNADERG
jgi:hypothetical protein